MPKKSQRARLAIGLISGTSMDGVDAALVEIGGPANRPRVKLRTFRSLAYPAELRDRLLRIASQEDIYVSDISVANFVLGKCFATSATRVIKEGRLSPTRVSIIGSHGQTIYHQGRRLEAGTKEVRRRVTIQLAEPEVTKVVWPPNTLQIAEPAVIAERTGIPVVADFRTADIAAGGQGAPLVPMVDYLLLRDEREGRVALNIGGIANVTVIPAGAKPDEVFGFDTGPGNMVMDALVMWRTGRKKSFDAGGRMAEKGKLASGLLDELLAFPFFAFTPPKSAGREQFGPEFFLKFFLERNGERFEDCLRTALELTARTIADAIEKFVEPRARVHRLIVSGGGAHNRTLLKRIAELLPQLTVETSDRYGLPVDAKEAIAFAILADRTMHGLPGNLPAVTGARRQVVLGKICRP